MRKRKIKSHRNKTNLKTATEEVQSTIRSNEAATKKILHQRKFKKSKLKRKLKQHATKTAINIEREELPKTSFNNEEPRYAQVNSNIFREPSKTNIDPQKLNKNIHESNSLSPTNRKRKQGSIPT